MGNIRKISKKYYVRQIVACWLVSCLFFNTSVVLAVVPPDPGALPTGPSVPWGSVGNFNDSITGELHIEDVAQRTVINWENFDIGSDALVQFHQIGNNPAVLNRVTGDTGPTGIFGDLIANGDLFIINTRGIVFGPESYVSARTLVASGIDISDRDFMVPDGSFEFERNSSGYDFDDLIGDVTNEGIGENHGIHAKEIALIGQNVRNKGSIVASGRDNIVVMAAGESVLLSKDGSDVSVEVSQGYTRPYERVVDNGGDDGIGGGPGTGPGTIEATDGKVILAAGDIYSTAIEGVESLRAEATGDITLNGAVTADGHVEILGGQNRIISRHAQISINEDITAGSMRIKNGKDVEPGEESLSGIYVAADKNLEATDGDVVVEAVHNVELGGDVTATGDVFINGDEDGWGDPKGNPEDYNPRAYGGGDVIANNITAGGNVDIKGNAIQLNGNVSANGGDLTITGRTSKDTYTDFSESGLDVEWGYIDVAEGKKLYASDDVVLKDAFGSDGEEPPAGKMDLIGHVSLEIEAKGGEIIAEGPWGLDGVKITVENSSPASLTMKQYEPLDLGLYTFGNQENTDLTLVSYNNWVTAVDFTNGGKNENAADQWASISATAETDITLQGHDASRDITAGALTSSVLGHPGNISVTSVHRKVLATGEINANNGSVTLTADDAVDGCIELHANITSSDFQDYIGDVELKNDVTAASTGGSDITFTGTVDGTHALTVNTAGVTKFQDEVGGTAPLASLTTDAPGRTEIWADIYLNGASATFNDPVLLKNNLTIDEAGTGNIEFASTVDSEEGSNYTLTVNSASGATIFGGAVGTDALADLSDDEGLGAVTTNAAGTTQINGSIVTTTGNQTYNDPVILGADTTLNGTDVTFANTLNSSSVADRSLLVNASGVTTFGGVVGADNELRHLETDAAGRTEIGAGTINLDGDSAKFADPVLLTDDLTINEAGLGNIEFVGTVDSQEGSNYSLTVNSGAGATIFGSAVGSDALGVLSDDEGLGSLTTNAAGTTQINGGSVTTTWDQKYHDAVTLGTDTTLNAGHNIETSSTLYGNGSLIALADNNIKLEGPTETVADMKLDAGNSVKTTRSLISGGKLNVEADWNIELGGHAQSTDIMKLDAYNNITADKSLTSGFKLVADAGNNIVFNAHVESVDNMNLYAGKDIKAYKSTTSTEGKLNASAGHNIEFGGHVYSADTMNLYAYNNIKADKSVKTGGKLNAEADWDIRIDGDVESIDNMNLDAGNKIEIGNKITSGGKLTALADNKIIFHRWAQSEGDMLLDAGNDIYAYGDLISNNGSIDLYSSDYTTYLGADVTAADNVTLHNNTKLIREYGDQTIEAQNGTLTAEGWVWKTTEGNMYLLGNNDDPEHNNGKAIDLQYAGCLPAASTSLGNLELYAPDGDIQISGDLTTFGVYEFDNHVENSDGSCIDEWYDRPTGGVSIIAENGKIYTADECGEETDMLNIGIVGNSDDVSHRMYYNGNGYEYIQNGMGPLGVDLPWGEEGKAAIVVLSREDLKFGPDTMLIAKGKYDSSVVDDRSGVGFLADPLTAIGGIIRDEGDPIDVAVYVGSMGTEEGQGNVHLDGRAIDVAAAGTMVVDAYDTVTFGDFDTFNLESFEGCEDLGCFLMKLALRFHDDIDFEDLCAAFGSFYDEYEGDDLLEDFLNDYFDEGFFFNIDRLEVVSRITEWLFQALNNGTLPYPYNPEIVEAFIGGDYILRGAGLGNPDIFDGRAWVLEDPLDPAPLYGEAGEAVDKEEFGEGGCPPLMDWLANEIGIPAEDIQVALAGALALNTDVQPCEMCARLLDAATILEDAEGTQIAAMARVVNEFVTTPAPPSPEQMTQIAAALAEHVGDGTYYAAAGQWIDALVAYVGIMNTEMGYSASDASAFAQKYLTPVTDLGNAALNAYVQARLAALGG